MIVPAPLPPFPSASCEWAQLAPLLAWNIRLLDMALADVMDHLESVHKENEEGIVPKVIVAAEELPIT